MTERRALWAPEIRMDDETRRFEAVVLRYNVIDTYNTRFRPGVFADSLAERLPRIVWAHDWSEPLGRYVDYVDSDSELRLVGEFDSFDDVPTARRAWAQLKSGTIDQFSVGFTRLADEAVSPDQVDGARGVVDITRGELEEASLVLVGAVPGTRLVSVRSPEGTVDIDVVVELAKRKAAGLISDAEADAAIAMLSTKPTTVEEPTVETVPAELLIPDLYARW
jgi:HK97 family phage prohead protease